MATLRIEIETDNAAFGNDGDDAGPEVFRILEPVIREWKGSGTYGPDWNRKLRDSNGNTVGFARVTED